MDNISELNELIYAEAKKISNDICVHERNKKWNPKPYLRNQVRRTNKETATTKEAAK